MEEGRHPLRPEHDRHPRPRRLHLRGVAVSLEACEGAVLLVDAAQGIEAQTLANLYLAINADLKIIPVLNKIDLPAAQPERYAEELSAIIGCDPSEVLRVSAKTGEGVEELLNTIVDQVPHPTGDPDAPARALIFDSVYDTYRGVVTYVRVVDGKFTKRERILMMSTQSVHETLELGVISPEPIPSDGLGAGEVGYLISGVKDVRQARVGDTVTTPPTRQRTRSRATTTPSRWCSPASTRSTATSTRSCATPWTSSSSTTPPWSTSRRRRTALGFGFRCGFLGLLHMEIVRERLEREFDLSLISTAPNVVYRVVMESGRELTVTNPSDFPGGIDGFSAPPSSGPKGNTGGKIKEVYEPIVRATIISPSDYIGTIMELCQSRRGILKGMDYLSTDRVEIRYTMPLAEIIFDFFDQLKSRTRGYASLDYEPDGEQVANLVKVDILLQGQPVDAFSQIVHTDSAREYGLSMTAKLKELIPRQQFEVPIQAAVGSRIIARENIRALRKDVLAKCYGGDITRKRKLLEKQKEGKKRMKTIGRVEVPQEAFVAALSTGQTENRPK